MHVSSITPRKKVLQIHRVSMQLCIYQCGTFVEDMWTTQKRWSCVAQFIEYGTSTAQVWGLIATGATHAKSVLHSRSRKCIHQMAYVMVIAMFSNVIADCSSRKTSDEAHTSETIWRSPIAIYHATGISGSTSGHSPTVIEGLPRPAETSNLGWLLECCCWGHDLVLGLEPSNNWIGTGVDGT